MKKIISAVTFLLVSFGFTANVNAAVVTSVSTSNERVIVVFKNKADKNVVSKARGNVRREYKNANVLSASVPTTAIKDLKDDPNVLAVEQDIIVKTNSQTVDWGVNKIQAPTAWSSSYTGKGVKIGIVDTGIANHEDLSVAGGAAFTSYTTSYLDDNGHGTHVAGIIGAKNNGYGIVGVANEASLYAIKVLGNDGAGYLSDIIAGIDWCITNKMDIINLSLGSSVPSTALQQEVDKAYNQGILVVAAAGNDGTSDGSTDTVDYPAKYSSVIAVAAPGVNVLSTYLNNKYVSMSGTSMSAPFVTGDLALLKQANPGLSPNKLRAKLNENVIDLGISGKDSWYGYGLIQAPKGQTSTVTQPISTIPTNTQPVTTQPVVSQPVTTQPSKLGTRTVVSTNKAYYLAGDIIYIKAKVIDTSGKAIQGAAVKFSITSPKGVVTIYKGMTDRYGEAFFGILTYRITGKGTYKVLAETTYSSYMTSSSNTAFQIY
ncbi:S8 family peptidase [Clostridium beijerinckii]|uniref:Minor extracellular protease Epr n=1 Tax=Clostridium beijerinckii TaxID=1520 RepID=A0A9Q5CSQ1_CLOBE|nr:S8 family serine peptidase [Clostridium beijerinckii]AQS06779.1 minor extracellular protease Epr precursor [Clostridium beijerinckii]MBA2887604.1 minor extracellular protease Epr [Clostridium beijerinckii]MBA2901568.1 minor extracellular protease Epr [Clostridium beijerinckii]MBA2911545.1 minor extracellular protease Epr [Clostridium beijerinckii]MBA9013592.1 minor extracellular protease Epr [Clostridium beijerinckii]